MSKFFDQTWLSVVILDREMLTKWPIERLAFHDAAEARSRKRTLSGETVGPNASFRQDLNLIPYTRTPP